MKRTTQITGALLATILAVILVVSFTGLKKNFHLSLNSTAVYVRTDAKTASIPVSHILTTAEKVTYYDKLIKIANYPTSTPRTASSTPNLWPAKIIYPNKDAVLPFKRMIAYYGNFYSKGMGVLGQYPPQEMLQKLEDEVRKWQIADPSTPTIPAIDYIAIAAQGSPGSDGKYRARMPSDQIEHAIELASRVNGLVVLDIQVGLSNLETEIPLLEEYLKLPQVELAIDPEFSMKTGAKPGTVVGTFNAADINYAAGYLANLVRENDLPPKVLIVHRYTQAMVTNYKNIAPLPEVEIVMDMEGWGAPPAKVKSDTEFS